MVRGCLGHMDDLEPVDITIPGHPGDPRIPRDLPAWVRVHYVPELHPDDVTVLNGIPITTVERTLIDLAEVLDRDELRGCFERAIERGLVDFDKLASARARVEWRPSLGMLDEVIAEFD